MGRYNNGLGWYRIDFCFAGGDAQSVVVRAGNETAALYVACFGPDGPDTTGIVGAQAIEISVPFHTGAKARQEIRQADEIGGWRRIWAINPGAIGKADAA